MNLEEFERLGEQDRAAMWDKLSQENQESILDEKRAWQKLSQEDRESLLKERRARRTKIGLFKTSSVHDRGSVNVALENKAAKVGVESITKAQGTYIIILLLAALGMPVFGILRPVQQWEYRIEAPSDTVFLSTIDQYGSEGWELVTVRRASDSNGNMSYECIFKRPKR
jgi:Domain of unknown function (DUF4177)